MAETHFLKVPSRNPYPTLGLTNQTPTRFDYSWGVCRHGGGVCQAGIGGVSVSCW